MQVGEDLGEVADLCGGDGELRGGEGVCVEGAHGGDGDHDGEEDAAPGAEGLAGKFLFRGRRMSSRIAEGWEGRNGLASFLPQRPFC